MQKIISYCDNCGIEVHDAFQCYAILKYNRSITGEILGHDSFPIDLCKGCTRSRFESLCANLAVYVPEDRMKSYAGLLYKTEQNWKQSAGCTVNSEYKPKDEKRKDFDMDWI